MQRTSLGLSASANSRCATVQFKTPEELSIMQYCNDVASAAHVELLRYAKPGEQKEPTNKSCAALPAVTPQLACGRGLATISCSGRAGCSVPVDKTEVLVCRHDGVSA